MAVSSGEDHPVEGKGAQAPDLPPIPPDGTSAPSRPDRVFGQSSDTGGKSGGGRDSGSEDGPERSVPYDPGARGDFRGDERDARQLRLRGRIALILGVGGLVFSVPVFPLGLGLSLGALAIGITTLRRSRRIALPAPGAKAGTIVGVVAILISAVVASIVYLFYSELSQWQECLSGANTRAGQEVCQVEFSERTYDRIDELLGR